MTTIRATNPANDRLGPYVFALAAGAIALSGLAQTRLIDEKRAADAKARAAIADKLLNRFASLYQAPPARRRRLP
jgi:hypothetical protein